MMYGYHQIVEYKQAQSIMYYSGICLIDKWVKEYLKQIQFV